MCNKIGKKMTAVIVCNGCIRDYSYYEKYFSEAEFVIGVDGGAMHLRKFGIQPDLMLGDFDSINEEDMGFFRGIGTEIMTFPAEKDMTDTELALNVAVDRGYKKILIIGGLGTRADHSLSNIFLLKHLHEKNIKGVIVDEHNEIVLIDGKIELRREKNVKVTLIPLSEKVEGVTTKGLYYPLDEATIEMGSTWGVSNEFADDIAEVTIKKGLMLIIKARD
ncbi:MAG: thiamine diphosphokinase [Clostridia bacterium]|nr:thiamine diphosphokinase [Clostridia bacterium]